MVRKLFWQPLSSAVNIAKEELENNLMKSYTDAPRNVPLSKIDGLAIPRKLKADFNAKQPAWHQVEAAMRKVRCKSEPGPNGAPHSVYRRCPKCPPKTPPAAAGGMEAEVHLQRGMEKANGTYNQKELNSTAIAQFRPIYVLNVEGGDIILRHGKQLQST